MKIAVKKYKHYAHITVDGNLSAMAVEMANGTWRLKDLNDNFISNVNYPSPTAAKNAYASMILK